MDTKQRAGWMSLISSISSLQAVAGSQPASYTLAASRPSLAHIRHKVLFLRGKEAERINLTTSQSSASSPPSSSSFQIEDTWHCCVKIRKGVYEVERSKKKVDLCQTNSDIRGSGDHQLLLTTCVLKKHLHFLGAAELAHTLLIDWMKCFAKFRRSLQKHNVQLLNLWHIKVLLIYLFALLSTFVFV
jgi:hypothetical protein